MKNLALWTPLWTTPELLCGSLVSLWICDPCNMDDGKENSTPVKVEHTELTDTRRPLSSKRGRLTQDPDEVPAKKRTPRFIEAERNPEQFSMDVPGRISRIELEDFMCHGNLVVDFDVYNKNCFYIGGPNGSGKSALFAAFNLALGGAGRQNDRGNSVKGYIKAGKLRAKLKISLTNKGQGSVDKIRDVQLGDKITIERTISQTSSTYNIKTTSGSGASRREYLVSTKKSDLDYILHRFNIQLANPVFWMSQDRSRQFLQQWEPSKMYHIVMEATGLVETERQYNEISLLVDQLLDSEQVLLEDKAQKKGQLDDIQNQLQSLEKARQLRHSMEGIDWLLLWTPLRDAQKSLDNFNEKVKMHESTKAKLKEEYLQQCAKYADKKEQRTEQLEQFDERKEEMKELENQKKVIENELNSIKAELASSNKEKTEIVAAIKHREHQIEITKSQMEALQNKNANNEAFKALEAENKRLQDLKQREMAEIEQRRLFEIEADRANGEAADIDAEVTEINKAVRAMEHTQADLVNEIKRSEYAEKDKLNKFGHDTSRILDLIKSNAQQFEVLPKGPLGLYVSITDKKWAAAVESLIGKNLTSYLFNSRRDEEVFKNLLKRNHIRPPDSFVTRFDVPPHDTTNYEPDQKYLTVLRVLNFSDKDVRNIFIDFAKIEAIILIRSDEQARDLMNGNAPYNCSRVLTFTGATVHGRTAQGVGTYRFYANQRKLTSFMLSEDSASSLDEKKAELENVRSEIGQLRPQQAKLLTQQRELNSKKFKAQKQHDQAEQQLLRTRHEIKTCQRKLNDMEMVTSNDGDEAVESMKDSIAEFERQIAEKQEQMEELNDQINNTKNRRDETQDAKDKILHQCNQLAAERSTMGKTLSKFKEEDNAMTAKLEAIKQRISDLDAKSEMYFQDRIKHEREVDRCRDISKQATGMRHHQQYTDPPDLSSLPPAREVHAEKLRLEKELLTVDVEFEKTYDKKMFDQYLAEYTEFRNIYKELRNIRKKIQRGLEKRREYFPTLQQTIIERLKTSFTDLMIYCKFKGHLVVDTTKKQLDIIITNNKSTTENGDAKPQDMKGLSGGERSYTTACLIMALWSIMHSPFRCMDEFDVFMDMINRKIVMDLLVDLATNKFNYNQFIFFTPQGIQDLRQNDRVDIFEMKKIRD